MDIKMKIGGEIQLHYNQEVDSHDKHTFKTWWSIWNLKINLLVNDVDYQKRKEAKLAGDY